MKYQSFGLEHLDTVKSLYQEANWTAYLLDDSKLERAFQNSLYLLGAFDKDKLIGFIRCVGDGEHILLIQDLIVTKTYRRQGIGSKLMTNVFDSFKKVRMIQLNTDLEDEKANAFYQSLEMQTLEKGRMISYFK